MNNMKLNPFWNKKNLFFAFVRVRKIKCPVASLHATEFQIINLMPEDTHHGISNFFLPGV
jgi:hypothetical protein